MSLSSVFPVFLAFNFCMFWQKFIKFNEWLSIDEYIVFNFYANDLNCAYDTNEAA